MSYVKHFRKTLISKLFFSLFKLQDLFFSKHCLPVDLKSFFFLYKLICARSQSSYFRKTKRHLQTRIREHLQTDTKSHILHQLNENLNCRDLCDDSCFIIIDYASSSFTLKLKETLRITWLKPALNKQKNHASVTSITSLFNQNFFLQIKKKTLWPVFMDRIQLLQGKSHFVEAVYFLLLSSQDILVLILSTSEG